MDALPHHPVAGVIFDCDGTLLDTMGLWYTMEEKLAASVGHTLTADEQDHLRACTLEEAAAFFYESLGVGSSAADVAATIEGMACDFYAHEAQARPGVLAFLEQLQAAGVRCAIASSSPHSMLDPGATGSGVGVYLDAIVSTDDVGISKREPAVYDRARKLLGTSLENTWVFEDAAYAVRTARAGGYHVMATWDCNESGTFEELAELADHAVRSYEEIDVARFLAGGYGRELYRRPVLDREALDSRKLAHVAGYQH